MGLGGISDISVTRGARAKLSDEEGRSSYITGTRLSNPTNPLPINYEQSLNKGALSGRYKKEFELHVYLANAKVSLLESVGLFMRVTSYAFVT